MAALITSIGGVSTFVIDLVGDVATVITAQPLLLIPFAVGLIATGVGLFKRLA